MALRGTRSSWTALASLLAVLLLSAAPAAAKSRSVLILPFAPLEVGREEQWLGEGVAESLRLSFAQLPSLVLIERGRLRSVTQPEAWDDAAALAAAGALNADSGSFGR